MWLHLQRSFSVTHSRAASATAGRQPRGSTHPVWYCVKSRGPGAALTAAGCSPRPGRLSTAASGTRGGGAPPPPPAAAHSMPARRSRRVSAPLYPGQQFACARPRTPDLAFACLAAAAPTAGLKRHCELRRSCMRPRGVEPFAPPAAAVHSCCWLSQCCSSWAGFS